MRLVDGAPVFSASDLTGFLACDHLLTLELEATGGRIARPERDDPEIDLLAKHGMIHETRYLEELKTEGKSVIEVGANPDELRESGLDRLRDLHKETVAALRKGPDVIYQGAFFDGRWQGYADFLLRVNRPSALGEYSYEVADTKLARRVKASALLQTCAYSTQLQDIQGVAPESIHVVLGDRTTASFRFRDFDAYFRTVRAHFDAATAEGARATVPERVEHCELCRWNEHCVAQWRAEDGLVFVAGLGKAQRKKLASVGIPTLTALATTAETHVTGIGDNTLARLELQARLQRKQGQTGVVTYELLPPQGPERGLASLPTPSEGDLFFDMEGDPLVEDGLEYLFGVAWRNGKDINFRAFWGHDRQAEKIAFEAFIDFVCERRTRWPAMHVFHYAAYEETALKRLMGMHGTREDDVDNLLRDGVLVDLYRVVRQGVAVSQESYSIKKLEPLYMPSRSGAITDAGGSIVAYERWLEEKDQQILDDIEAYNRDDCISTLHLRNWLEARRTAALSAGAEVPRPPVPARPPESALPPQDENADLVAALVAGESDDPARAQARWLLAQLLGYHRREKKSEWWEYFDRCDMSELELLEDGHAIGGLEPDGEPEKIGQSWWRRYRFPEEQDYRLGVGGNPHDPTTKKKAGEITELGLGTLRLKHGRTLTTPRALIPSVDFNDEVQREALRRLARFVIAHGVDAPGQGRATRDVLLRRAPRLAGVTTGRLRHADETAADAGRRLVIALDSGYLPIQGPPGTGKTYAGADMALDLVAAGKKVGVVAHSHAVIGNFLDEIRKHADKRHVEILIAQCAKPDEGARDPRIGRLESKAVPAALTDGLQVVGGTAWLYARPEMQETIDVLFIDEAGQLSLANALAVGGAARNIVLLGDPNQLAQPSRGAHPIGAAASVLGHVLGSDQTIPEDTGLFLDRTHRLRPEVCAFTSAGFYEDRLEPEAVSRTRSLAFGNGLRFEAVSHTGNKIESHEEAERVKALITELVGQEWTDEHGTRPLGLSDIVVVAPYNAQVELLKERLPQGARVGTVDKFQGQEAAVAIYSMASSTDEDAPRGMDFLYSRNRLNVAVSRAQALAIIVASPELLRVRCKTPKQMRLANALCLFAEMAAAGVSA
jgi:predicted RecB family nuclease